MLSGPKLRHDLCVCISRRQEFATHVGVSNMRWIRPSMALGVALAFGVASSSLIAQDQPAAGAPPAAAASEAPSPGTQPSEAQPNTAQPGVAPPVAPHSRRAPNPKRLARTLAKKLSLTPEQQSQVESILTDRQQQVRSARADSTLAPRARRAQVRRISQNSNRKIEALLNDTQKQQYAEMKQERNERRQMRKQQQADAPPAASNE